MRKSKFTARSSTTLARYQNFSETSDSSRSSTRLIALRNELKAFDVNGLLLPRADVFQGEYLPRSEDRLAYLTAFTGSAGFAIVLEGQAALFADGRYTVQARAQVDSALITVIAQAEQTPEVWLAKTVKTDARIGYDPSLFTRRGLKRFEKALANTAIGLIALPHDPVSAIWSDRPNAPATEIVDHPCEFAGETREAKLARLQAKLADMRVDALLVSECPSLNWLFNIRAQDVQHLPILRAFAIVPREGRPTLFAKQARFSPGIHAPLAAFSQIVEPVAPPGDGAAEASDMLSALARKGKRILLDEDTAAIRFEQVILAAGGVPEFSADPIALMKAQKNPIELEGARAAHLRDGAAMSRFLTWLDHELPRQPITEIDAAVALEGFRTETNALLDVSFPSISAAGPNAALPHYRVSDASNRKIAAGLYLIDSGGQYRDGTTDITRTIGAGRTSLAMRRMFTRVLKGMIAISRLTFPKGTSGAQIDAFARASLWEAGTDFDHGTGHGVGSFLSVHEGPQRISKFGTQALLPGMILSNEPGYYREGHFGIRIENLVVVEQRDIPGAEREMLGFETITFVPIDRSLIIKSLLTRTERAWIDGYHCDVLAKIGPLVSGEDRAFLDRACRPL